MKILFTGGGSGGHFYPLIAVAEEINNVIKQEKLVPAELYYMSDSPYDSDALVENNLNFVKIPAGKIRRYFSILNIFDFFKTIFGVLSAFVKVFNIFPDVIFSKGAYSSFPVLFAGRFFRIPIIIHESDSFPGRTNKWAGKFAEKIAVSYPEAAKYFNEKKVAITGQPVRKSLQVIPNKNTAREFFGLSENAKVILVLGGSLGAEFINEHILEISPKLVEKYYIIHQIGKNNMKDSIGTANIILGESPNKFRYKPFDFLDNLNMNMAAGAADLIVSRAGSTIFEIAYWGKPSILIPITNSNGDHQRKNAYYYARSGAATVIEENNVTQNILYSEIERILNDENVYKNMSEKAKSFIQTDASNLIAKEILHIALAHEK